METVGRLVVASPPMVNRAHYAAGTLTTTYEVLSTLRQANYLHAIPWRVSDYGNPRLLYTLATAGYKELVQNGVDRADLIQPSRRRTVRVGPLGHLMEVNDLIVNALALAKADSSLKVRFKPEPILRRRPLEKAGFTLIPDAWVQFTRGDGEATLLFELDKSTIPLERIEPRLRGYLVVDQSEEYRQLFGTLALVVVWVVADGDVARRDSLRRLTRAVLGPHHPQADLFLFGMSGPSYFDHAWYRADTDIPQSLLPVTWRQHGHG